MNDFDSMILIVSEAQNMVQFPYEFFTEREVIIGMKCGGTSPEEYKKYVDE